MVRGHSRTLSQGIVPLPRRLLFDQLRSHRLIVAQCRVQAKAGAGEGLERRPGERPARRCQPSIEGTAGRGSCPVASKHGLVGSITMRAQVREEKAAEIRRAVRGFLDAMAREDFEHACSYFSNASRAFLLTVASATGLKTESCGAAWAHLVRLDTDIDSRRLPAMWEQVRGCAVEVKVTGADRAAVEIDPSRSRDSSELPITRRLFDELGLNKGLPLVKEDGEWKLGLRGVDDSTGQISSN